MISAIYRSAVCHNRESARPLTLPTAGYLNSAQGGARKCALFPRRNHPRDSKTVKINVTTISAFTIRLTCARVFRDLRFINKKGEGQSIAPIDPVYHNNALYVDRRNYRRIILVTHALLANIRSFRILCAAREITSERSRCFDYLPRNYSAEILDGEKTSRS